MQWTPTSFDQDFLGLRLWQWIGVTIIIACSMLMAVLVSKAVAQLLKSRLSEWNADTTPFLRRGIRRSAGLLAISAIWTVLLDDLDLPGDTFRLGTLFANTIGVVAFFWLLYCGWQIFAYLLEHRGPFQDRRAEKLLLPLATNFVRFLVVCSGIAALMAVYGVNVSAILAGIGIGGLVVALAAKDSVENVFGSLTLLFDMPFAIGDWVKIADVEGEIEQINLRSTRIRTSLDTLVTLPNSNLIKSSVENYGLRRFRRYRVELPLSNDQSVERIGQYCTELRKQVAALPGVVPEKTTIALIDVRVEGAIVFFQTYLEADTYSGELLGREQALLKAIEVAQQLGVRFTQPIGM